MSRSSLAGLVAALLLSNGCATDTLAPGNDRFGRYTLRTINGSGVPALVFESTSARLEFVSGSLRLNRDNSYTDSTDVKVTPLKGGDIRRVIDVAAGTYRFSGDTVFFDSTRGEHYHMVFQVAGSLMQELAGALLVYRK
jgi:hypothetical protein